MSLVQVAQPGLVFSQPFHHLNGIRSQSTIPSIKYLSEERKIVKQLKEGQVQEQKQSKVLQNLINEINTPQNKIFEERYTHSRNSTHLNDAIENLEFQWESMKKQHGNFDQRSSSGSPAKFQILNNLKTNSSTLGNSSILDGKNTTQDIQIKYNQMNQSNTFQQQKQVPSILKKVVPLSKINLASMFQINLGEQSQQNDSKLFDQSEQNYLMNGQIPEVKDQYKYQNLVNKYSNRIRSPESFSYHNINLNITQEIRGQTNSVSPNQFLQQSRMKKSSQQIITEIEQPSPTVRMQQYKNQPKRELYNRNNLKMLDEKVRSSSKEASPSRYRKEIRKSKTNMTQNEKERTFNNPENILRVSSLRYRPGDEASIEELQFSQKSDDSFPKNFNQFNFQNLSERNQEVQFQPLQSNQQLLSVTRKQSIKVEELCQVQPQFNVNLRRDKIKHDDIIKSQTIKCNIQQQLSQNHPKRIISNTKNYLTRLQSNKIETLKKNMYFKI